MTCQYFGCDKQADFPFLCCDVFHGEAVKVIKSAIKAGEDMTHYNVQESRFDTGHPMTHEEFEHYARLVGLNLMKMPHLDLMPRKAKANAAVA